MKDIFTQIQNRNLFDLSHTLAAPLLHRYLYFFDALPHLKDFLIWLTGTMESNYYFLSDGILVAKTAKISKTAHIQPPCIICDFAEVRHTAYIRGNVLVGENCVVGNSCEIKNSILFNGAQVPHFNYVGDSIFGFRAHIGAGVITANLKSDKSPVVIKCNGQTIDTNLKKVGAALGDFVEVGCNSVLFPATVIGKNSTIYPLCAVRGIVEENCIYKNEKTTVEKNVKG